MGYLDENPEFHHQLLLVRGVSDEQHTAEVGLIARHMRERFGVRVVILGRAATEFDAVANRVRKADLAEPLVDPEPRSGRWWPRAALAAAEAPLTDSRARVARWAAGDVAVAAQPSPLSAGGGAGASVDARDAGLLPQPDPGAPGGGSRPSRMNLCWPNGPSAQSPTRDSALGHQASPNRPCSCQAASSPSPPVAALHAVLYAGAALLTATALTVGLGLLLA